MSTSAHLSIEEMRKAIADKEELVERVHLNNELSMFSYVFTDAKTFLHPNAVECRGITFDASGKIVSRPFHKFFNVNERAELMKEALFARTDLAGIYEKLDGSMIATCWHQDELYWRSKSSFTSEVVELTKELVQKPPYRHIAHFARSIASKDHTAIFELTHPEARIVLNPQEPKLRLLQIRKNDTGEYVLLDPKHPFWTLVHEMNIEIVQKFNISLEEAFSSLETMKEQEGYVLVFSDGTMVKAKCPWYLRLHRSITFLRARDIAKLALYEELDDVRQALTEAGIDLSAVDAVAEQVKTTILKVRGAVETFAAEHQNLPRKEFVGTITPNHPYFSLIMQAYDRKEPNYRSWYEKYHLKQDFGLEVLDNRADRLDN